MTSAEYDQKVQELMAKQPEPRVDTSINTTSDREYNGNRVPRMWVENWALQRTAAEIKGRFGSPNAVHDNALFKEWVYWHIAAVDAESGTAANSVTFELAPDETRGGVDIVKEVKFD